MANPDLPQSTTTSAQSAPDAGATVRQFGGDVGREPDGSMNPTPARVGALLIAAAGIVQAVLALVFMNQANSGGVFQVHSAVGMFTILACIIASVLIWLSYRRHAGKGPLWHALGMTVLAVVQVGLGEGGLRLPHIILGVLFLIGAIALVPMAFRRPRGA